MEEIRDPESAKEYPSFKTVVAEEYRRWWCAHAREAIKIIPIACIIATLVIVAFKLL
jgi:hypothetical protein